MKKIAIIGLGYVGLPLAVLAKDNGYYVYGIDKNEKKINELKNGKFLNDDDTLVQKLKKTNIHFSTSYNYICEVDIAIICVPTPVNKEKVPDLTILKDACISTAKMLKKGSLLVVESTINPGVCDELIIPLLEKETDHKIGKSLFLAHCPERINPGDMNWNVSNINRVLGADSATGLEMAYRFYADIINAKIKKMGSIKEAEAVKIVENTFRDVNIALVNELAMSFDALGINVINVIDGAATKPFAFMAHYPGIGVGGHCIPVDPYYLIEYAMNNGFEHKFLSLARSINESMPIYAINQLEQALVAKSKKRLENTKVTVLGLSYKSNVADDRESPAYIVIDTLKKRGYQVSAYDPYIPKKSDFQTLEEAVGEAEAIVLVTNHKEFKDIKPYKLKNLLVFLDGRNAFQNMFKDFSVNNITYIGIGR